MAASEMEDVSVRGYWNKALETGSLDDTELLWPALISTQNLYGFYVDYCRKNGIRFPAPDSIFVRELKKIQAGLRPYRTTVNKKRVNCLVLPWPSIPIPGARTEPLI